MKRKNEVNIDWKYEGKQDLAMGTEAVITEKLLGWLSSFVIPLFFLFYIRRYNIHMSLFEVAVGLILAFDVGGGMICNSLNSCKRFYHSPVKPDESKVVALLKNHLLFASLHIHSIIVGIVFGADNWFFGITWYILFMISVVIVELTPLYLKRPLSMLVILIAIMINFYIIIPIQGFEWLIPALFIKIIYGHLVREEPYRPIT